MDGRPILRASCQDKGCHPLPLLTPRVGLAITREREKQCQPSTTRNTREGPLPVPYTDVTEIGCGAGHLLVEAEIVRGERGKDACPHCHRDAMDEWAERATTQAMMGRDLEPPPKPAPMEA